MTGPAEPPSARLEPAQFAALVRLVGEDVAREDEPAVAEAYADFQDAMAALRRQLGGPRT